MAGRGLFATDALPSGTVIWFPCQSCPRYSVAQLATLASEQVEELDEFGYRLEDGSLIWPCSGAHLFNHSCEANVLDSGLDFGIAVRRIAAGEELTCDYRTFLNDPPWQFSCWCGSPSCSGTVASAKTFDATVTAMWRRKVADACDRIVTVDQPLAASLRSSSWIFAELVRGQRLNVEHLGFSVCKPPARGHLVTYK